MTWQPETKYLLKATNVEQYLAAISAIHSRNMRQDQTAHSKCLEQIFFVAGDYQYALEHIAGSSVVDNNITAKVDTLPESGCSSEFVLSAKINFDKCPMFTVEAYPVIGRIDDKVIGPLGFVLNKNKAKSP